MINEAIKKAIEGGYDQSKWVDPWIDEHYICDPNFWKSLGKALGTDVNEHTLKSGNLKPYWFIMAMRYHELNLTGGNLEAFWSELLNPNK